VTIPAISRQWVRCPRGHRLFRARGQGREIEIPCRKCDRLVLVLAAVGVEYLDECDEEL